MEIFPPLRSTLIPDRPLWLHPGWGLAIRSTVSMGVPLLLAALGWLPLNVTFVAIGAHGLSLLDVRGPYALRFGFLLTMCGMMAGACALGLSLREWPLLGVLGAGLLALNAGLWRHLTPDYGNYLSIPVGLQFFMALMMDGPRLDAAQHNPAASALVGSLWATLVHMALWPVRPEHPLRRAIADGWVRAAELFAAASGGADLGRAEAEFRSAYDKADGTLAAAAIRRPLPRGVGEVQRLSARLVTRASALQATLEAAGGGPSTENLRAAHAAATESLAQAAEAIALVTVSQQPAHLALTEVRLKRSESLLEALLLASGGDPAIEHMVGLLVSELRAISAALVAITSRAGERGVIPLELFDLRTWKLHPLAALLNLRATVDPMIVRFAARLALLLMAGTLAMAILRWKGITIPHAYWLPFTMLIVAQTDYGATRQRALERLGGTLFGSLLASAFLFIRLPSWGVFGLVFLFCFLAGFSLKKNYSVFSAFITLMVVMLAEMSGPATLEFSLERIASTAAGGGAALLATLLFWPAWERHRHASIAAGALRANHAYLTALLARLTAGGAYGEAEIAAKRDAERASATAIASLGRMYAEPRNQREGIERAAVIVNGNARLIRVFNHLLVQAREGGSLRNPQAIALVHAIAADLDRLATCLSQNAAVPEPLLAPPSKPSDPATAPDDAALLPLLRRARIEVDAMLASHRATVPPLAAAAAVPT